METQPYAFIAYFEPQNLCIESFSLCEVVNRKPAKCRFCFKHSYSPYYTFPCGPARSFVSAVGRASHSDSLSHARTSADFTSCTEGELPDNKKARDTDRKSVV